MADEFRTQGERLNSDEPTDPLSCPPEETGSPNALFDDLPDPRATRVRFAVLAWLSAATAIAYIDRGCISVAEKLIRHDLGMSESRMGWVMSSFFITYAVFQLPASWLDRVWGSRRSVPFFAAAWSLATACCGLATGTALLLGARLVMGAAEAGIFPAAIGIIKRWFPTTGRASASGLVGSFMGVGGAIGTALSGVILAGLSWRAMFLLYALPGFIWACGFAWWFRDRPRDHPAVNAAELALIGDDKSSGDALEPRPWWALLSNRAVIGLVAQQFLRAAGTMFFLSWFPTYLMETRGVNIRDAGLLTSLPHWASVLGSIVGGWISDAVLARTGSLRIARQGVAAASLTVATLLIGVAYPVSDALLAVLVLSAGAFAAALAGPSAYALTIDLGGRYTSQVFAIMNTSGSIGSIVFPIIAPWVVLKTGSWDSVLVVFGGIYLAAAASWLTFDARRDRV